jgi:hypothetical protein
VLTDRGSVLAGSARDRAQPLLRFRSASMKPTSTWSMVISRRSEGVAYGKRALFRPDRILRADAPATHQTRPALCPSCLLSLVNLLGEVTVEDPISCGTRIG